jgi:hypothetical protein
LMESTADMRGVHIMAADIMAPHIMAMDITATSRRRRQRPRHSPVRRRPSSNSRRTGRAAAPTGTSASKPGRPRRPPKHNQQNKIEIANKGTASGPNSKAQSFSLSASVWQGLHWVRRRTPPPTHRGEDMSRWGPTLTRLWGKCDAVCRSRAQKPGLIRCDMPIPTP